LLFTVRQSYHIEFVIKIYDFGYAGAKRLNRIFTVFGMM